MDNFYFDEIKKKDKDKDEFKNELNYKTKKEENAHSHSNKKKPKKLNNKNKIDKNSVIIIKKLENENARLRKLLITYKLKKSKYDKSTEKMKKYNNYFEKKIFAINAKQNKVNNSNNLSCFFHHNNDSSLTGNLNNLSNIKNSYGKILGNIFEKIPFIPKNKKKNSESCAVLLTEGNVRKSYKRSKGKEIGSNSKNNKILITDSKLNKTNNKIKKYNKAKMNSIYFNKSNNIIDSDKELFEPNRNAILNHFGNDSYNLYYEQKKNNNNINDKLNNRNLNMIIKSNHDSLKLGKNSPNLGKQQNDYNLNNNNTNIVLPHTKIKIQKKNIKSFNKNILGNLIVHNSVNNTSMKINNLFEKKRNQKIINKKKYNNYHSISSITEQKLNVSKFNSSVSFDIKKLKLNENEKSISSSMNTNYFEQYMKKSEKNLDNNNSYKDKSDYINNKNKLQYFLNYTSKVKKIINENFKKNAKNMNNNNIRNDNKLINSHKKKNNIFFTINKTIIQNMNNTFNNNTNKNCLATNNNNSEDSNNDEQSSPNTINIKKKLIARCHLSNMSNNTKFSNNKIGVLKTNPNERTIKKIQIQNKNKILIN